MIRWLITSAFWLAVIVILVIWLNGCATMPEKASTFDSFCQAYHRVILTPEEGVSMQFAPRMIKERVAANDALFRCRCEGWQNAICESK